MGMILDALDRKFCPVTGLSVFHVEPERCRDTVDDADICERSGTVQRLFLIVIDLEMYPEIFCDPGNVACVFTMDLWHNLDHVARLVTDDIFFQDAEFVVVEVRRATEVVIRKIRPEERIILRTCRDAPYAFVFREIGPEVALGEGMSMDQEPDVL